MNKMRNWLYNFLIRNYRFRKNRIFDKLLRYAMNPVFTLKTILHGRKIIMPSNYSYPLITRNHPGFNNPYLELIHQTWLSKNQKLSIVDVGAAIGDTFLFIKSNIPQAIKKIYCVEGSSYFFSYLERNTGNDPDALILNTLLSDEETDIPALIHHHGSSAMAAGKTRSKAATLDTLIENRQIDFIDVLKIDVDGHDGKVLKGASDALAHMKPSVIFEFHPELILKTGNDVLLPFETLANAGYQLLLWYDKFGNFSHESTVNNKELFKKIADSSTSGSLGEDWHYDIIALHDPDSLDLISLKNCSFASTKPSPW